MARDILIVGTGYYAEIMVGDLAAVARAPLSITIGGRNPDRLRWLKTAASARAAIYGSPLTVDTVLIDQTSAAGVADVLRSVRPRVVVQSASLQSPWKVDRLDSPWSRLVAEGGFGLTLAFHSVLPSRTAAAIAEVDPGIAFVNTCYPDGVNQVLRAAGLPITTGVGNVGIFASVIAGLLPLADRAPLRVLAHHQHLVQWRKPGQDRTGAPVRAWLGDDEMADVEARSRHIQLPYRDLNAISGASAVPVLLALAGHGARRAHVPGPAGLPGGYPVYVDEGSVTLDLPADVSRDEAVAWNQSFEEADGVSITNAGWVMYSERASKTLGAYSPSLAKNFHVHDLDQVAVELDALRARLSG